MHTFQTDCYTKKYFQMFLIHVSCQIPHLLPAFLKICQAFGLFNELGTAHIYPARFVME